MPLPSFEDRHAAYTATGYSVTNEEPVLFNTLLKNRTFKKVAAISSAGEVPLIVLIPRTREQLVLVDHSYKSLATTYLKIVLLRTLGARELRRLLTSGQPTMIREKIEAAAAEVPTPLQPSLDRYNLNDGELNYNLRREWYFTPLDKLREAARRLEQITISMVHGDLLDIADSAPFDLLYISNALDGAHRRRNGTSLTPPLIDPLVGPRGIVLSTGGRSIPPGFKEIGKVLGYRTSWEHRAWRRAKA